jgi:putative transposase
MNDDRATESCSPPEAAARHVVSAERLYLLDARHLVRVVGGEDFGRVAVEFVDGDREGQRLLVALERLADSRLEPDSPSPPLMEISQADWEYAEKLVDLLKPFVDRPVTFKDMAYLCAELGLHKTQIYQKISQLKARIGSRLPIRVSDFVRQTSNGGKGRTRLSASVLEIFQEVCQSFNDTPEKPSPSKVIDDVRSQCRAAGMPSEEWPCGNTIRKLLKARENGEVLEKRAGPECAEQEFGPAPGQFPNVEEALEVVLCDFTRMDVVVISEETGEPIGRPWLGLGIE